MAAILDEASASLLDEGPGVINDEDGSAAPSGAIPASDSIVPVFLTMNL